MRSNKKCKLQGQKDTSQTSYRITKFRTITKLTVRCRSFFYKKKIGWTCTYPTMAAEPNRVSQTYTLELSISNINLAYIPRFKVVSLFGSVLRRILPVFLLESPTHARKLPLASFRRHPGDAQRRFVGYFRPGFRPVDAALLVAPPRGAHRPE